MGFFKKRPDPMADRSRALKAQIAALEDQIKQLSSQAQKEQSQPRLRSSILPHGQNDPSPIAPAASSATAYPPRPHEPLFESVDHRQMTALPETENTPAHYNDLGVRKYDLVAAWRRIQNHLHGPTLPNPKLVSYLAAGTIKGLRPLRYEKRVARNRVMVLTIVLVAFIWGILYMILKQT